MHRAIGGCSVRVRTKSTAHPFRSALLVFARPLSYLLGKRRFTGEPHSPTRELVNRLKRSVTARYCVCPGKCLRDLVYTRSPQAPHGRCRSPFVQVRDITELLRTLNTGFPQGSGRLFSIFPHPTVCGTLTAKIVASWGRSANVTTVSSSIVVLPVLVLWKNVY